VQRAGYRLGFTGGVLSAQVEREAAPLPDSHPAGADAALARMFDAHAAHVFDYCLSLLWHQDEAADATQATFVIAHELRDWLWDASRQRAWLCALARAECRASQPGRAEIAWAGYSVRIDDARVVAPPPEHAGEDDYDPPTIELQLAELEAYAAARKRELAAKFAALPDSDREILDLVLRHEVPAVELPAILGISAELARTVLTAGMLRLQPDWPGVAHDDVFQAGVGDAGVAETELAATELTETELTETELAKTELAKTELAKTGLAESGLAATDLPETGLAAIGLPESGLPESGLPETDLAHSGTEETGPAEGAAADSSPAGQPVLTPAEQLAGLPLAELPAEIWPATLAVATEPDLAGLRFAVVAASGQHDADGFPIPQLPVLLPSRRKRVLVSGLACLALIVLAATGFGLFTYLSRPSHDPHPQPPHYSLDPASVVAPVAAPSPGTSGPSARPSRSHSRARHKVNPVVPGGSQPAPSHSSAPPSTKPKKPTASATPSASSTTRPSSPPPFSPSPSPSPPSSSPPPSPSPTTAASDSPASPSPPSSPSPSSSPGLILLLAIDVTTLL
jgi:DNA-directed RNA polymerase specialized sigma24 family protein